MRLPMALVASLACALSCPHELWAQAHPDVRVLYTGRLLGYYYALDQQQPSHGFSKCPDPADLTKFSPASKSFIDSLSEDAILVGTGDNFAPKLEARKFTDPPNSRVTSKELYTWDYATKAKKDWHWIENSDFTAKHPKTPKAEMDALDAELQAGKEWIPADNVACFLALAHYAAIVPGKHDFYFGPERLRSLARVLASFPANEGDEKQDEKNRQYRRVDMLGSNLVIKTTWVKNQKFSLTPKKPPVPFVVPANSRPSALLASLKPNIPEGGSVYPWLQFIQVRGEIPKDLHGYIWDTNPDDPTDIRLPPGCRDTQTCAELFHPKDESRFWLNIRNHSLNGHFSTLDPGENYAFCLVLGNFTSTSLNVPISCTHFSVYRPFFLHPSTVPTATNPQYCGTPPSVPPPTVNDHCYDDPYPFVLKEEKGKTPVAIFGVIDPRLKEHVGGLNASWRVVKKHHTGAANDEDEAIYRTEVSAEEPAEALEEMEQYFDRKYCLDNAVTKSQASVGNDGCKGTRSRFPGLRILLAEMTPAAAQELGARMPEGHRFDVIIPQASEDFATPHQLQIVSAFQRIRFGSAEPTLAFPAFMAVPPQAWPSAADIEMQSPIRSLRITELNGTQRAYEVSGPSQPAYDTNSLSASVLPPSSPSKLMPNSQAASSSVFQGERLLATKIPSLPTGACSPHTSPASPSLLSATALQCEKALSEFVLSAMQQKTGADVTILQKRDFYWEAASQLSGANLQTILDGILWKGDFLTVQAILGSTLTQALKESKGFDQRDQDNLSLDLEKGRGLIELGISESSIPGEYTINDAPLDPGRLYTVATTDYIALGDTGYPELAVPAGTKAFDPQYSKTDLQYISSAVCEQVLGAVTSGSNCNPLVQPEAYFDELANMRPADLRPRHAEYRQFRDWFFHSRRKPPAVGVREKAVQERPIWSLNLEKLSLGYGALYHKFSETDLNNFFGGVQNSDATSPRYISWNLDEKTSFTKSNSAFDAFASQDLTYIGKFTAQQSGPSKPNQQANRMEFDTGSYFHTGGNRAIPHFDIATVLHLETQFATPITQLKVTPANPADPHDNTLNIEVGRTWTLLGRVGPRWHNRRSYIEGGIEGGRDLNAITAFQFVNQQGATIGPPCILAANNPLQTCVKGNPAIDTNSRVDVQRAGRLRTGIFWHGLLDVPIIPKVTESLENEGDFFFNSSGDNSTDTRLRHLMTNKITFQVFPSLSFSPTYQLFLFRNKVDDHFLWQQQATITIDFSFNLTNWRVRRTEFEYKKPPDKK